MVTLNLVIPCFFEDEVRPETTRRLLDLLDELVGDRIVDKASGITYIDDGSHDHTWAVIQDMHTAHSRVHAITLSRKYGHRNALLAGLLSVEGDFLISLDADLQDDLVAIPRMIAEFHNGAEIVFGVRERRDTDSFLKRFSARNDYRRLWQFGVEILQDHADFRLMTRRAIDELRGFREVNLFLRGIVPLLGFRAAIVRYDRHAPFAGKSKYPLIKMIALASDGVACFSTKPPALEHLCGGRSRNGVTDVRHSGAIHPVVYRPERTGQGIHCDSNVFSRRTAVTVSRRDRRVYRETYVRNEV
ncbi:glycosyltransferase family 2 protein [Paraburkholderia dinghuensis]|uniref:glycosyltransferase family 2 protein n=1 Tax=Paraburkholderia dinghuensis TaxID=2305225 RepID=UPI001FE89E12|nr:glycosyltransferase family 2 protein [Paraburkholderia dinghuensis]